MARFKQLIPALKVTDLQRTIDYYTQNFGATLVWCAPNDGGGENAWLDLGGVSLLFSTGDHLGPRPQLSGTLYIDMEGVETFFDGIKERVEIVWPLERMPYGTREFGVRDCNGYVLAFSEGAESPG
jgi:uncharacterized glyoxalase superfamily protein PhnB